MIILIFLLNLPWTIVGLLASILSVPRSITFSKSPLAIIFYVRSFWWCRWVPGWKGIRGMANGHVIQLSKLADDLDLKHELVHVEQFMRYPFVGGFLLLIEVMRHGTYPPRNKYEKEAYERAGNRFGYFVED